MFTFFKEPIDQNSGRFSTLTELVWKVSLWWFSGVIFFILKVYLKSNQKAEGLCDSLPTLGILAFWLLVPPRWKLEARLLFWPPGEGGLRAKNDKAWPAKESHIWPTTKNPKPSNTFKGNQNHQHRSQAATPHDDLGTSVEILLLNLVPKISISNKDTIN